MMSSTWFSGCGIMPSTLPRSLTMPAIECAAPLTLEALVDRSLGGAIAIEHPSLALEPLQRLFVRLVIALAMGDRDANDLAGIIAARERRVGSFDPQMHVMADEFQPRVAHQHAGQQSCLAEDLKTVADAEHQAAVAPRTRAPRPSPARARRWRRSANNRRRKIRRAPPRGRCPLAARSRHARPSRAHGPTRAAARAPCRARD